MTGTYIGGARSAEVNVDENALLQQAVQFAVKRRNMVSKMIVV